MSGQWVRERVKGANHNLFLPLAHETLSPLSSSPSSLSLVMLPRHVRRIVLSSSTPLRIRTALANSNARAASLVFQQRQQRQNFIQSSSFHSSARRQNDGPKSPFQTFVEVLREELRKNRELQDNVKQLQGDVDKIQDSEAMKRARAAYERARVCLHL